MSNLLKDTPAFKRWNVEEPVNQLNDWQSYQAYVLRADLLLCAIDLFWPEFVLKDDLILRKSNVPEDWETFINQAREANWSATNVEYTINHIHISDIIFNDPDREQISLHLLNYLAEVLAEMWQHRVNSLFPNRKFKVEVYKNEDPEVSVYTIKD